MCYPPSRRDLCLKISPPELHGSVNKNRGNVGPGPVDLKILRGVYPPVNQHGNEISPFLIGNTS